MTVPSTFDATSRFTGIAGGIANNLIEIHRAGRIVLRRLARAGARAVRHGINAWLVRQAIRELQSLDGRMLADFGLSRSQIESAVRQMTPDWPS